MKSTLAIGRRNRFGGLFALFIPFVLGACARTIAFETSAVVPAAVGKVKMKKDKNNNYSIEVNVTHLASPKRLTPPKEAYVVWVETPNSGFKNVGRITIGTGFLSKTLTGSLRTSTSFKPVKVFITGESAGEILHPGVPVVLTTKPF